MIKKSSKILAFTFVVISSLLLVGIVGSMVVPTSFRLKNNIHQAGGSYLTASYQSSDWLPSWVPNLSFGEAIMQVDMSGTAIGDTLVREIAGVRTLQALYLESCSKVTDDGIVCLQQHPELVTVDLYGTAVSDLSLNALATIPSLRLVVLGENPNLTEKDIADFQAKRPDVEVDR